ncbi:MAG: hypothetical protein A2Y48_04440 [Nitrospirae bacterium RIFCSPLOW2_12_42_9]|nr:MAG: hypothetical protein A2Y48_04440 [Nitrospirae bacterium RIFCSPLOW2_12_42_9]
MTIVADSKEDVLVQQKYYWEGDMVRVEEESKDIEGNPGIKIYDFQKKKLYTILLNVKLYLEQDINFDKEDILFETPPEKKYSNQKDVKVEKIKLGEDTIDGHTISRYEIKVIQKRDKKKEEQVIERYLLWEAEDLEKMPVKYEFELPNKSKRIIKYIEIISDGIDPSMFSIPDGYQPVSPF